MIGSETIVWAANALWLWLALWLVFRRLGLPFASAGAAVLSWIAAGVMQPWLAPATLRWSHAPVALVHWLTAVL